MASEQLSIVDCDIHPSLPGVRSLYPYIESHWRAVFEDTGVDEQDSASYPANAPLTARPDWRPAKGKPAASLDAVRAEALDLFGSSFAICNCLYGVQLLHSEDMAASIARAINAWTAAEWLDVEPRLRASIVVPVQNPAMAAEEIERCAGDRRFVQVLMLVSDLLPLGKRHYWPIYEAAARHGLPVGIHAGSSYRHPPTPVGWPTYYSEDYAAQSQAFQTTLTSLICEGVFANFPDLKVVMIESGFTWLPSHLWRITKLWRGLRFQIPWVDSPPAEIVRESVRFTLQPLDAPDDPAALDRIMNQVQSDELLLFSTDYPHWQFDGTAAVPEGLSATLKRRIMHDNPLATYTRLKEPA